MCPVKSLSVTLFSAFHVFRKKNSKRCRNSMKREEREVNPRPNKQHLKKTWYKHIFKKIKFEDPSKINLVLYSFIITLIFVKLLGFISLVLSNNMSGRGQAPIHAISYQKQADFYVWLGCVSTFFGYKVTQSDTKRLFIKARSLNRKGHWFSSMFFHSVYRILCFITLPFFFPSL